MNKPVMVLILGLAAVGCSPEFWGGGAAGVAGAGAGYELRAHQQMQKLDDDLKNGRINQQEYDIRKDQIEKGSIIQ